MAWEIYFINAVLATRITFWFNSIFNKLFIFFNNLINSLIYALISI